MINIKEYTGNHQLKNDDCTLFIQLRYTDLLGKFLAKYVQADIGQIENIFDELLLNTNIVNQSNQGTSNTIQSKYVEISSQEQFGYPIRKKGGYDAPPFQDSLLEFRFEVADILRKYYSIQVTNLNHEVA